MDVAQLLELAQSISYPGIFGMTFVANLFPGIPEEVFMLVLGAVARGEHVRLGAVMLLFWVGLMISDVILFTMARRGVKPLMKLIKKLPGNTLTDRREFFERHIGKIIFVSRFVLYFRWIGPVMSGVLKVSYKKFLIIDAIALAIYVPLLTGLGWWFAGQLSWVLAGAGQVRRIVLIVVIVCLIILLLRSVRKRFITRYLRNKGRTKQVIFGFEKIEDKQ